MSLFSPEPQGFHDCRLLPYHRDDIFDLVLDVKRYPEFLPWCTAAHIIPRNDPDPLCFNAVLMLSYYGLREQFTSTITANAEKNWIRIEATGQSLQQLKGMWCFEAMDNQTSTQVNLRLDWTFRLRLFDHLAARKMSSIAAMMCHAFEKRAAQLKK